MQRRKNDWRHNNETVKMVYEETCKQQQQQQEQQQKQQQQQREERQHLAFWKVSGSKFQKFLFWPIFHSWRLTHFILSFQMTAWVLT